MILQTLKKKVEGTKWKLGNIVRIYNWLMVLGMQK